MKKIKKAKLSNDTRTRMKRVDDIVETVKAQNKIKGRQKWKKTMEEEDRRETQAKKERLYPRFQTATEEKAARGNRYRTDKRVSKTRAAQSKWKNKQSWRD